MSLGIDVVRNRIKGFAQKKVTLPQGRHKLVILDEADRFVLRSILKSGYQN
jgi:DNA polymerase III delta prime subunit